MNHLELTMATSSLDGSGPAAVGTGLWIPAGSAVAGGDKVPIDSGAGGLDINVVLSAESKQRI